MRADGTACGTRLRDARPAFGPVFLRRAFLSAAAVVGSVYTHGVTLSLSTVGARLLLYRVVARENRVITARRAPLPAPINNSGELATCKFNTHDLRSDY